MISWLISTTLPSTTGLSSEHVFTSTSATASYTTSFFNTFGSSFGGDGETSGQTILVTQSESGSGLQRRATITSANEEGLFFTASTTFQNSGNSESGVTTIGVNSGQSSNSGGGGTGQSSFTTGSLSRFTFSVGAQTSTTQTTSTSVFAELQSGLSVASNAITFRQTGGISTTSTSRVSGSTTASAPRTTQTPPTYWFFRSTSTPATQTITTTSGSETSPPAYATVYEAAPNEVIYLISEPTSYAPSPIAARELASTFTRITVTPTAATETRQFLAVTQISEATGSESLAVESETELAITSFGPDSESSTFERPSYFVSATTNTVNIDFEFSETVQSITQFGTQALDATEVNYTSAATNLVSVFSLFSGVKYVNNKWVPEVSVGPRDTATQLRYGKRGWDIASQRGLEPTPTTFFDAAPHAITGSISRGRATVANVTKDGLTINSPSVTYDTQVGGALTTSSIILGVSGNMELVEDDIFLIQHIGGGGYAESWTIVDRVAPDCAYSDLINEQTTTYIGNDTSYSGAGDRSASHLTFEPHLYRGSPQSVDVVFWTESRNLALPPL
jgi:hypothetical protein